MSSMSLYTSQRCALFVYLKCTHTYLNHRLLYDSFFSFRCVSFFFLSCDGNSLFAKLIFPIFIESNRFTSTVARTSLNFSIKTFQTEVFISFNFFGMNQSTLNLSTRFIHINGIQSVSLSFLCCRRRNSMLLFFR